LKDYSNVPKAVRFVDDVWVSAHSRVQKYVFPAKRFCFTLFWKEAFFKSTSLAKINNWGRDDYAKRNNSIAIKHFADKWNK